MAMALCCCSLVPVDAFGAAVDPTFRSPLFTDAVSPARLQVLPDDSFFVHSAFNRFNNENVGALIKFHRDGTRDPGFHLRLPCLGVAAISIAPNGQLVVSLVEQGKRAMRWRILRLNADGSVDSSFAASTADRHIASIHIQPDGKMLVGGSFTEIAGQKRSGLVRFNADGSLDESFPVLTFANNGLFSDTYATGIWSDVVVQPDGKILFAGVFSSVNGAARPGLARLNADGTLDTGFAPTLPHYLPRGSGTMPLRAIGLQPSGHIVVGGRFAIDDYAYAMARLTPEGSSAGYWGSRDNRSDRPLVRDLKVLPDGSVIAIGDRLYPFGADGSLRAYGSGGTSVDTQSDGQILTAGTWLPDGRPAGVQRFSLDGSSEPQNIGEFQLRVEPEQVATRSDGRMWVSTNRDDWTNGADRVNGIESSGVARLLRDGSVDRSFDPAVTGWNFTTGFALQANDSVLLHQSFTLNAEPANYRRYLADDSVDPSFQQDPSAPIFEVAQPAPDGGYIILEPFSLRAILNDTAIRRLTSSGLLDQAFSFGIKFSEAAVKKGAREEVYVGDNRPLAFYPDGRFIARYLDATGEYRLRRFNADGSVDATFQPGNVAAPVTVRYEAYGDRGWYDAIEAAATPLTDVAILADGKLIVTGMFKQYNGVDAGGIVRLHTDGTPDGSFNAGAGAQWVVTAEDATHMPRVDAVEPLGDGTYLITGDFEAFDGVPAPGMARLHTNGAVDTSFIAPVELAPTYDTPSDIRFRDQFPISQLIPQPDGTMLLLGNFARRGSAFTESIIRLKNFTGAALLNVSTRLRVETGENVLIGGFIITGNEPKKVVVRGLGPSLSQAGVSGALADPTLELRAINGSVLASNDNWTTNRAEIEGSGVPPQHELEAALVATLEPGAYTAIVSGRGGSSGAGLVEVYDIGRTADAQLANISTRGSVKTDTDVMIGGFILGNGTGTARVAVRAIGPSLAEQGVGNALANPTLELRDLNGQLVLANNDWQDDPAQAAELQSLGIAPSHDREAALVTSIPRSPHTAIVRGTEDTTGVGLVEIYNLQ